MNRVPAGAICCAATPGPSAAPFARLPHALAGDTRLSPTDRLVGAALLFWARDQATCAMANRSLADYVGVSIATVERALRALARLGYIAAEAVRPTAANLTGRVVRLRWVEDPGVLPAPPPRSSRPAAEAVLADPTSEPVRPDGPSPGGPSPMMSPPPHPRGVPPVTGDGPPPSPVTDKEDRRREKGKNPKKAARSGPVQRQRSQAVDWIAFEAGPPAAVDALPIFTDPAATCRPAATVEAGPPATPAGAPSSEPDAPPPAHALDRAMVDARQAASMTDEPINAGPGDLLAAGQRQALAAMTADERRGFDAKSPELRVQILAPFARGFEAWFFERITRAQLAVPRFVANPGPVDRSTAGLVAAVAGGDPRRVAELAESLCRDLGGPGDRRRWGALHALARQLLLRAVAASDVLDAYRQAMGPRAVNRGAVFTTALKRAGWRPDATRPPAGATALAISRAI